MAPLRKDMAPLRKDVAPLRKDVAPLRKDIESSSFTPSPHGTVEVVLRRDVILVEKDEIYHPFQACRRYAM
jgi:hypothetical protein